MNADDSICHKSARELAGLIATREVSVVDVMTEHLEQIARVNPQVNAICTLAADTGMEQAAAADAVLARGVKPGPLFGLPTVIKDLAPTKGMRTTMGSPIYADWVPDFDALFVERIKAAGAIVIGKSNTPEFGAGSHTFNEVFGVTRNPYDLSRSAGGSSGGAGAALASRMVPFADGSDLGGSVRNPASFNNVVGLRPSPGRIPRVPSEQPWDSLPVLGPMARRVADVALLLSVMAGPDARDPIAIGESPDRFAGSLDADFKGTRIAWSRDLGQFPVETQVIDVIENSLPVFTQLGCEVEETHPDFSGAPDIFQVLRAQRFASDSVKDLENHRAQMKDTVIWNIEQGQKLSAADVSRAQNARGALFARLHAFFGLYDFLILPVAQVLPFPVETDWVREINGISMSTYIDWMMACSLITLTEHPSISLPCGFSAGGLPVGLQIVGPYRGELAVLQLAHAFEAETRVADKAPSIA